MNTKDFSQKNESHFSKLDHDKPVQLMRDTRTEESIERPASEEEMEEAVEEINPDENSMDSRG